MDRSYTVQVLLFPGVEELDAVGPWEVLRFWSRLTERDVRVSTVSLDGEPVVCGMGLRVTPDGALGDGPPPNLFLHPGGPGTRPLQNDADHLETLRNIARAGALMASVCTGATVYAAAGLLDGHEATSHWRVLDDLRQSNPQVTVRDGVRWVDDGSVVTSAGVAAGIDMALHLVHRLESQKCAGEVARMMEYPWAP